MFCPIFTAASVAHQGSGDKIIDQCEEKECAWWITDVNLCAVTQFAVGVVYVGASIVNVATKMPHEEQFRK